MLRGQLSRSTLLRFFAIVLFAATAVSLTAVSARAFSQGTGGTDESGNAAFADPDEQVNIFGMGFDQGPQPSGLAGSVQISPEQRLAPFKHFQPDSLSSPPDPLARPSN